MFQTLQIRIGLDTWTRSRVVLPYFRSYADRRHAVHAIPALLLAALIIPSCASLDSLVSAEENSVGLTQDQVAQTTARNSPKSSDDPVFWKQYVFSIPYHVNRKADDPDAPAEVSLLVSTDRGQSWAEVSRVLPNVRGFTYYAPRDGEYWFSLQTVDSHGNRWPVDEERPKLRVVVDTHPPKLLVSSEVTPAGAVSVAWQTNDQHLVHSSLKIEMQSDADAAWQPVTLGDAVTVASLREKTSESANGEAIRDNADLERDQPFVGRVVVPVPPSAQTIRFRSTIADRAGNLSETSAEVSVANRPDRTAMLPRRESASGESSGAIRPVKIGAVGQYQAPIAIGPTAGDADSLSQVFAPPQQQTAAIRQSPESEPWPADTIVADRSDRIQTTQSTALSINNPFVSRPTSGTGPPIVPQRHTQRNGQTRPPNPPPLALPPRTGWDAAQDAAGSMANQARVGGRSPNSSEHRPTWQTLPTSGQPIQAVGPTGRAIETGPPLSAPPPMPNRQSTRLQEPRRPSSVPGGSSQNPPMQMVNSRSFSIEYEVQSVGSRGVGRVELWGTMDGGATWRRYGTDPDHRSPMEVAVDGEGEYGFRIVVHTAGSYGAAPPRAGDSPDVWVRVDLKTPAVSVGSVQKGRGNQADQLTVRWTADDEYLAPDPIALLFAAHPAGPWTTIATRLENTGHYTWRLGEYVPEHLYIRVEARDEAGNVGAYSTAEPVVFERLSPTGRIQGVRVN